MKNFFIKLLLFFFCIAVLDFLWMRFFPDEKQIPFVWLILFFFVIMTALFHFLSFRTSKGKPKNFVLYYMGASALRLILYSLIILAYRFYDQDTLIPFAAGFMAHYFLFTVFEVRILLKEFSR